MEWPCQAQRILDEVAIRNASGIASCRELGYGDENTVDEEARAGQSMHGGSQSISLPLGRHCENVMFQVVLQDSHTTKVSSHRHFSSERRGPVAPANGQDQHSGLRRRCTEEAVIFILCVR